LPRLSRLELGGSLAIPVSYLSSVILIIIVFHLECSLPFGGYVSAAAAAGAATEAPRVYCDEMDDLTDLK